MERFQSFSSTKIQYPHVHLCFDDHSVAAWYSARGVLMDKRVKAVFYVDSFDELDEDDIHQLRLLRADGHVIGCHSMTHVDAVEYSQKHGVEAYIENEVIPAMESMTEAGFAPTHFAFPYSSFDEPLHEAVSKLFCHVRLRPGNDTHYSSNKQMFDHSNLLRGQHTKTYEHRIRSGEMPNVIAEMTDRLKTGHGINLVFHAVHRLGLPKSEGSHADDNGFVTVEELSQILNAVLTSGAVFETFAEHCKVDKDPLTSSSL